MPDFQYSIAKRKKKLEEMRNRQKERWMMHMYRAAATERGEDAEGDQKSSRVEDDFENLEDMEDGMDAWLKNLNFEEYITDWSSLATSICTMDMANGGS
jgi:hypothetical protein